MKQINEIIRAQRKQAVARYYNLNSSLGNDWAIFHVVIGGRKTGKSYDATNYLCRQKKNKKEQVKNYWLRISETSTKALLENHADKLVDPDLKRKYKLQLTRKGSTVYNKGREFINVLPLSAMGKLKGIGFYDKDFTGWYNIVMDEFQLEQGEKRTSFDILYNFIGMCENIARTTKGRIKVILLGNTLEEASTILKAFNFLPEKFGRFYLKSKKCVIDNIEPTEEYLKDRKGSIADILGGDKMSNYTNALKKDLALIDKSRTIRPTAIIKFAKETSDWYTIWDGRIIKKWNHEKLDSTYDFCMKPYLSSYFNKERRQTIIDLYDARALKFNNLITQAYFEGSMQKIRK